MFEVAVSVEDLLLCVCVFESIFLSSETELPALHQGLQGPWSWSFADFAVTSHARTAAITLIIENAVVPAYSGAVGRGHVQAVIGLAVSLISFPFGPCFLVPLGVFGLAVGVCRWGLVVVGAG